MEWSKLTKNSLKKLKTTGIDILLYSRDYQDPTAFDVTQFLDLDKNEFSKEEMKHHWTSLIRGGGPIYEYDDDDLLNIFSHYLVIDIPNKG